jgi:ubiquinone/menaquinone biosynthesis C-methylase UbiE
MSSSEHSQSNSSFILPEGGALIAWLYHIDALITRGMDGILAERGNDISGLHDVLDLGCGAGGWAMEIAGISAAVTVTGVDINERIISHAQMHAKERGLDNAHFQVMNIQQPLAFPDASFDLVNARTLFSSFRPADWPPFLKECVRILRPGGVLRLTELERNMTTSPALERFWDLYSQALLVTGRSFSIDGKRIGIVPQLGRLLHEAGLEYIEQRAHLPQLSSWKSEHNAWQEHTLVTQTLLEPFLVESGVTSGEECQRIREQARMEMLSPTFCGIGFFMTAWGSKPKSAHSE